MMALSGTFYRGLLLTVLLLAPLPAMSAVCADIVGTWAWFVGGTVTFSEDNRVQYMPGGQSALPPGQGSWTCDAQTGTYTVNWNNGFFDTLRLSEDRNTVSGSNSSGIAVFGTRKVVTAEQLANSSCPRVLGDWEWFNGGKVTFFEDQRVTFKTGDSRLPDGSGSWACDPVSGVYSVAWVPGFNETLQLSEDGNGLSGKNVIGHEISGWRPGTRVSNVDCSQAPSEPGDGACRLLTPADLCTVTGRTFASGRRISGNQSDSCRFDAEGGTSEQVEIGMSTRTGGTDRQGFLNVLKSVRKTQAYQAAEGPWDHAYTIADPGNKRIRLHVLKGNQTFTLQTVARDYRIVWREAERIAQAIQLGRHTVVRLEGGDPIQAAAPSKPRSAQATQQRTQAVAQVQSGAQLQTQSQDQGVSALSNNLALSVSDPPGEGVEHYVHGLDALERAQWDDAIQHFSEALAQEVENPDYLTARGVAFTLARRLKDAEADLERADRLRPGHKPTKVWWASAVGMQGRFEEDGTIYPFATLDQYESAVRKMSRDFGERYFRQSMGDETAVQQAMPAYHAAIASFPTLAKEFVARAKSSDQIRGALRGVLRKRGIASYKAGQCDTAYPDLVHASRSDPDDSEVLYYLAGCKLKLGSPEGARADYTAVLLELPGNANAAVGRALAHAALGDVTAARRDLDAALSLNPDLNPAYQREIEQNLAATEPVEDADERWRMLQQLQSSVAQNHNWASLKETATTLNRSIQNGRLRADEQYQLELNRLRKLTSGSDAGADQFAALGQFLYQQALISVGEAVEPRAPNRPYRPQTTDSQKRELALAEQAVDQALALNPNHARALAFKGACRFKRDNEWVLAEEYLSRAIELDGSDPVIQDLFATVLDYIAFVQAAAAAELRSVDTWSDAYYIYYRYPSQAELERAKELDAIALRLWQKARKAMENAIAAAPTGAQSDYYRSILAERDGDLSGAAAYLKRALEADDRYFEAAQRLSLIATKLGQIELAYSAQSIATNLVHTSAASMLKLAWIEFNRGAYETAGKALRIGSSLDPADPRIAAYLGAVARENGDDREAASWLLTAVLLEEMRLSNLGIKVREGGDTEFQAADIARLAGLNNAAARLLLKSGKPQSATELLDVNFRIYGRLSQQSRYLRSPYGLLPEPPVDPTITPEAPTIEALIVWATVIAGQANTELNRYDIAMRQFQWAASFESRKPLTVDQGMAVRIPGLWAKLGMADVELRRGNPQGAAQLMQGYGHPVIATPEMRAQTDRLRNAIEAAGYRSGGQTLTDQRDRQRRLNQQQSDQKIW